MKKTLLFALAFLSMTAFAQDGKIRNSKTYKKITCVYDGLPGGNNSRLAADLFEYSMMEKTLTTYDEYEQIKETFKRVIWWTYTEKFGDKIIIRYKENDKFNFIDLTYIGDEDDLYDYKGTIGKGHENFYCRVEKELI